MQIVDRLRHNWPLLVAVVVLIASLILFQGIPYAFSKVIPFDTAEIVDYPNLLYKYGGFPLTRGILLMPIAIISLLAALKNTDFNKTISAIIILIAGSIVCVGCSQGFLSGGDQTTLSHMQTIRYTEATYQLARERNRDDSGGLTDSFWVFRCEADEAHCLFLEHSGLNRHPVTDGDNPPTATLTIDPATNALYLQIGDEKMLIAE